MLASAPVQLAMAQLMLLGCRMETQVSHTKDFSATQLFIFKKSFKWWALLPKTSRCQCVLSKENHSCILSCPAPSKGATGSRTPRMDPTGPGDVSGSGSVCEKQDKKDICSVDN